MKYNFATPFALAEAMGLLSGLCAALHSLAPGLVKRLLHLMKQKSACSLLNHDISLSKRVEYAADMLHAIGLTERFSPCVVLCGHGSMTQNNAYATALDCGACGGRAGGGNARVMAQILNDRLVREKLKEKGVYIPEKTYFIGAEHNTTTGEVELYEDEMPNAQPEKFTQLKKDLHKAMLLNNTARESKLGDGSMSKVQVRAQDWAQVRPEWGLARNASLIVGPRSLTEAVDLDGRAFLHSYNWKNDTGCSSLTAILTAPMVVAQWINSQYLFSTLDNSVFGGGDKVTINVAGKLGVVQGNGSDLMTGLPLQSVYRTDCKRYHEPMRLLTIVYAPRYYLDLVIDQALILKKLFGNSWVNLVCLDPESNRQYQLKSDLTWFEIASPMSG